MKFKGKGIREDSCIYFYTPSQNAKKMLYYPVVAGEFFCNSEYIVHREKYDSILMIFIIEGSMTLEQDGVYTASKNELLIVDCYKPHKYYTNNFAHTVWIHFDGNNSKEWFKQFQNQKIKCNSKIADRILRIIENIKTNECEYDISSNVYSLLCEISKPESNVHNARLELINIAKDFIEANYQNQLTVDIISNTINLSASYFSKIFKEATNLSPYDYLLSVRLEKSKELLHKTDYSISNIAYLTGFNSDANFIYFFKKKTGISPLKFKRIIF